MRSYFFQDNEKNHSIAFVTELFFEKVLEKRTSRSVYFIYSNGIRPYFNVIIL
jgi:hypothetical protein